MDRNTNQLKLPEGWEINGSTIVPMPELTHKQVRHLQKQINRMANHRKRLIRSCRRGKENLRRSGLIWRSLHEKEYTDASN